MPGHGTTPKVAVGTQRKIDAVVKKVLGEVKPTSDEIRATTAYSNEIMARLKRVAPKNVEIIFAGSVARGTQIRGNSDIDIFLLFPKGTSKKEIGEKGLEIGKRIVAKHKNESYIIKYAEHPYMRLMLGDMGIKADIVPAFKIKDASERVTAVDRTQLHNKFVNENLTSKQKDDVRVLKAFLKAHRIYGAEAKTSGVSGYLCELLIYQYGSFTGLLYGMSRLRLPTVIDPLNKAFHHGADAATFVKKFGKDFAVLDPTDSDRNVAAVITDESLARFSAVSKLFLRKPTPEVFYGRRFTDTYSERQISRLRKELGISIYLMHFKAPDIAEDIVWQQATRLEHSICSILSKSGFDTIFSLSNVSGDDAIIAFFLNSESRGYTLIGGPTAFMGDAITRFVDAHSSAYAFFFDHDRISALEKSIHSTPESLIRGIMKSNTEIFPSYINRKKAKLYVNDFPEPLAKELYASFVARTSL